MAPTKIKLPPKPQFVPLDVPLPRRRETLSVLVWMCLVPLFLLVFLELVLHSVVTRTIALVYLVYVLQDQGHERGGRRSNWVRSLTFFTWFRNFFPITMRKEADLDPSKKYIFGYHPHGVISLGAFACFGTESCGISTLFPGLDIRLLTLESNFKVPFFRDLLLALNVCSVSKQNINYILSQPTPGSSVTIVIGGAAESLEARPGHNKLHLQSRLGFIKIGLKHGASLVPTFAFGENDVWEQVPNPEGSLIRQFQNAFKSVASFSPVLFHGRGIFTYNYGMLPYRRPIVVVTGNPIDLPVIEKPTEEDLKMYQKLYIAELQRVYDAYKDELLPNRVEELVIA
ncbi:diacylglycerol O-acyltransferase 1 [Podochytrium sp. JEL0797]|nr:diacylglycerol O-acyltransferase 1 [Podochytrium sp. JEL0797]